jgi:hypothetical protein
MAKILKFGNMHVRVDSISLIDKGEGDSDPKLIRLFITGLSTGYHMHFEDSETRDTCYDTIVKAMMDD